MSRSLQAVLIDMDGTLVDTERLWFVAEGDVVSQLGGVWRPEHQAALDPYLAGSSAGPGTGGYGLPTDLGIGTVMPRR